MIPFWPTGGRRRSFGRSALCPGTRSRSACPGVDGPGARSEWRGSFERRQALRILRRVARARADVGAEPLEDFPHRPRVVADAETRQDLSWQVDPSPPHNHNPVRGPVRTALDQSAQILVLLGGEPRQMTLAQRSFSPSRPRSLTGGPSRAGFAGPCPRSGRCPSGSCRPAPPPALEDDGSGWCSGGRRQAAQIKS